MITDISPPPIEPVTLDYAKTFLRVDTDDDDQLISDLIKGSRLRVEDMISASLISRPRLYTDHRPRDCRLFINHTPVTSVSRIGVVARNGTVTDVPAEDYMVSLRSCPATIYLENNRLWTDYDDDAVAVEAEIDAGYGASANDVPMQLRQAILLLLAQSYEHRDSETQPPLPMMVDALTMPYRGLRL